MGKTLTDVYGSADINRLNMIFEAQGKKYELYREGNEIRWRNRPFAPAQKKKKKDGADRDISTT